MDVLNCRFAAAVDVCPCDNIKPYETVVCKGEGGSLTRPHALGLKNIYSKQT